MVKIVATASPKVLKMSLSHLKNNWKYNITYLMFDKVNDKNENNNQNYNDGIYYGWNNGELIK